MGRHVNIPIFIPHLGCPNQCVFCNQRFISGVSEFDPDSVRCDIDEALSTVESDAEAEIAFFGGSFTGIDRDLMVSLLRIASEYVDQGRVSSIRCSTRPDYIDAEILDILKIYKVNVIELGIQSVDESVLKITKRGHAVEDTMRAVRLIKEYGFTLVGQMMIGLPGSSLESEIETAEFIAECGAEYARIYPTIVFKDTELYGMTLSGLYQPLSTNDAVIRSARVFEVFHNAGVKVIRIGLCASENLESDKTYYRGPNHPALGELILSEFYFKKESDLLENHLENKSPIVLVSRGHLSRAIGQKRINKTRLISEFGLASIEFREDDEVSPFELKLLI